MAQSQIASLSLYIITFNCGRSFINVDDFASQLFSGLSNSTLPDLFVLSLQEIAPISLSFISGTSLVPYFERFIHAVRKAAAKWSGEDDTYTTIAVRNLGMTGMIIFAKDESAVQDIEHAGVGVGVSEMGDKGAVGVRFTYNGGGGSTELTFVAAHLQAMEDAVQTRNQNWQDIVRRLVFSSEAKGKTALLSNEERPLLSISSRDASIYKPTSHLFVAGDLNYRTSTLGPAPQDYVENFPQPQAAPTSPKHYSNLYKLDQLNQERAAGRTLHGLTEAKVTFPPTYKYDSKGPFLTPDEDVSEWSWARHRWPSWCDRILYLDIPSWLKETNPKAAITTHKYTALPLLSTSDHRPVALEATVPLIPIPPPHEDDESDDPRTSPPFEIDIDWKSKRDRARTLEVVSGYMAYFSTTLEGAALFLTTIAGALGAVFAIKMIMEM
jgi:hypothetical protein